LSVRSPVFDSSTHERWVAAGRPALEDRLREAALRLIADRRPVLDEAAAAAVDSFWLGER
jgi:hypothetical protein